LGSAVSFVIVLYLNNQSFLLVILNNKEEAAYYFERFDDWSKMCYFIPVHFVCYEIEDTDNANVLLRAEVLNRINPQETGHYYLSRSFSRKW
jgi:transcription-repair coupling factor (superfamily II helicase)